MIHMNVITIERVKHYDLGTISVTFWKYFSLKKWLNIFRVLNGVGLKHISRHTFDHLKNLKHL